jgi:hypothetical protein
MFRKEPYFYERFIGFTILTPASLGDRGVVGTVINCHRP